MLPLILKMALPAVAAQLVNLLYSIVDRIYIGHIEGIGKDALAGVGITASVTILISAFSSIVGAGGSPLAAIALGQGDREKAARILNNGFIMLMFFSVLTSLLAYAFMESALKFSGASEVTMPYAKDYLSVYLIGTVFVQISTGLNLYINCQGRPGIAMLSVIIGALLNTLLDPLFIFVFKMGVAGAAFATVISQGVSAAWILIFLFSKRAGLRLSFSDMRLDFRVIGQIMTLGISPFVMASTESLVGFVMNGTLGGFGDIYVSALTVMQSTMQIVSVPMAGFAQGFVPIISYNYGHKNHSRVKECFRISLIIMFTFNFVFILLMVLMPGTAASVFTDDVELVAVVSKYMPAFMTGMLIFGLQRACQNTFVALGQAKTSLFIALLRKVILLVPLVLLLSRIMGVAGTYAAESIADFTAASVCTVLFAAMFPKILRKNGYDADKR